VRLKMILATFAMLWLSVAALAQTSSTSNNLDLAIAAWNGALAADQGHRDV
jgi:hypothetical protein